MKAWIPIAILLSPSLLLVTARAAEPITPHFVAAVDSVRDREAAYLSGAYTIVHVGNLTRVKDDDSWWRPVRGLVYRIEVEHDAFFNAMGRPDLAGKFASRRALGRTLEVGGYIAAVSGVLVGPWGLSNGQLSLAVLGAGMMIGGVVARFKGADMQKPTLPEDDAIDMAARYNRALREHLQLPASTESIGIRLGGRF